MGRLAKVVVGLVLLLVAAQLVRPERANPPIEQSRTIRAQLGATAPAVGVLARACNDCHSNETVWPSYTAIAPLSWLMAYGVKTGRSVLNFSEWGSYPRARQQALLAASCADVRAGKMPGAYTWFKPETKLSAEDIETICAAALPEGAP